MQLYLASRGLLDVEPSNPTLWVPPLFIRQPLGVYQVVVGDICEVIPSSGDFYKVRWVQVIHLGFTNAYLTSLCEQCSATGATPRP